LPHEFRQSLKRALFAHQDMKTRLANLRRAGFIASAAVDGGAFRGEWSRAFWSVWPESPSVMIEPLAVEQPALNSLAATRKGSLVVAKAISNEIGEIPFRIEGTNSRIADGSGKHVTVPCTTLDAILGELPGIQPNLLKLDLQGYELQALQGCEWHLKQFEVIILEVSVLKIGNVPLFSEVDHFMAVRGYRLYDALPQYYRPRDGALWQMDVFFVRENSPLIASRSWD
jgi:FkbM family methyltransferase